MAKLEGKDWDGRGRGQSAEAGDMHSEDENNTCGLLTKQIHPKHLLFGGVLSAPQACWPSARSKQGSQADWLQLLPFNRGQNLIAWKFNLFKFLSCRIPSPTLRYSRGVFIAYLRITNERQKLSFPMQTSQATSSDNSIMFLVSYRDQSSTRFPDRIPKFRSTLICGSMFFSSLPSLFFTIMQSSYIQYHVFVHVVSCFSPLRESKV